MNSEKTKSFTIERTENFLSKTEWIDVNLTSCIYSDPDTSSITLKSWSVPNTDPNETDKVSYTDMLKDAVFEKSSIGQSFSPEWSTHWFKGLLLNIFLKINKFQK